MTTTRRRQPSLTGGQLQNTIIDMAAVFGLHTAHFRKALTKNGRWITAVAGDGKGWPDLVIVGLGGLLHWECKGAYETVSDEQTAWIAWLTAAGANVAVRRPKDLRSGLVERELRALRLPRIGRTP
jgi:hypothetical protein